MIIFYAVCTFFYLPPLLFALVKATNILIWIIDFIVSIPLRFIGHRTSVHFRLKWQKKLEPVTSKINFGVGLMEYYIRPLRNYLLGLTFLVLLAIHLIPLMKGNLAAAHLTGISLAILFICLTVLSMNRETMASLKMAEFLRVNPEMDPTTYFHNFYRLLGPFKSTLPESKDIPTISPEKVSFKKHVRSTQGYSSILPGVWDTAHLAHACLRSLRFVGKEYAREVFDLHASMWGKRLLQLFNASMEVTGAERLNNLKGKVLLVFNHKSLLDFALSFFALSGLHLARGRKIRQRFITAKDHFVDNVLVYELLGVGKLIEAVDMVFIERKRKGKGLQDLRQAAEFLSNKEIEIAIYPQGTRAEGNIDRSGKSPMEEYS